MEPNEDGEVDWIDRAEDFFRNLTWPQAVLIIAVLAAFVALCFAPAACSVHLS